MCRWNVNNNHRLLTQTLWLFYLIYKEIMQAQWKNNSYQTTTRSLKSHYSLLEIAYISGERGEDGRGTLKPGRVFEWFAHNTAFCPHPWNGTEFPLKKKRKERKPHTRTHERAHTHWPKNITWFLNVVNVIGRNDGTCMCRAARYHGSLVSQGQRLHILFQARQKRGYNK